MIRTKFLAAIFLGTAVYSLLSMFFGINGVWCYKQLSEQKRSIAAQTEFIQKLNDELNLEYSALLKDKGMIASYARKLDYVGYDEKLVKITGLKPKQSSLYDTGIALKRTACSYISEKKCKLFGFTVFFISFIIMISIDLFNGKIVIKRKKSQAVKGIPIYDLPQV